MKPRIQKRKAFTLVEILIVICVISILFVVLVSRVDFATDKARQAGVQNDMHALQYAIHQVALEKGELVDDLNLLASLLNENLDTELMVRVEGNMLKTHATDPWGNEYQLRYNKGIDNKGQLQVLSAGPDSDYLTNDDTVIAIVCSLSASGTNVIVKEDLSTNEIIKEDGTLPNQPVAPEHVCSFSRRVQSAQFLKTAGNCKTEAIYFYSCECGAVGTATFTGSKNPSEHVDNPTIVYNSYNDEQHTKVTTCVGCNVVLDTTNINHTFNNNKCTDCNYERHVHSYTNQNPVEANKATSATCSAAATYYYTCACGAKGTSTFISGNALAHNYSGRVTTDPTCTATGVRTYTCSTCNDTYTELVEVTPHNYNKQIEDGYLASAATCKDYAKYYYSCVCGKPGTQTFNGTELSSTHGDTETKYEYINESEHKVSSICKICNTSTQIITTGHGNLVNNKCSLCKGHVHSFTRKVENANTRVTEATCTKYATYKYSCADTTCNVLSDSSNTFEGSVYAAHIEANGKAENVHTKCSICGTTISSTHSYSTPVITKAATCTTTGTQEKACTCGYVKTESVTALGHDLVSHAAKTATCTSIGWNAYETCNRCNYTTYKEIAKKAHTSTNGGTQAVHEKCSICGTTISFTHSYGTPVTTKAATCTSTGTQEKTCSCGYVKTETIAVLGHDLVSHAAKTATCTSIGWNAYETCNRCTYTTYKEIAKKTHTSVNGGTKEVHTKCSVCNTTLSSNHSYTQTTTKEATCISTGTKKYSCTCGYFYNETIAVNSTKHSTSVTGYSYIDAVYHAYTTKCSACNKILSSGERYMHRLNTDDDYCEECYYTRPYVEPCIDSDNNNVCDNCNSKVLYGIWVFKDNPTYTKDMEQVIYFTTGSGLYCSGIKVWTDTMDIFVDYYEVFDTWSCWDNKCEGTWRSDNEKVNFGTQPQPVSTEFFNWVMANANREYAEVSGKWTFNTTLIDDVDFNQFVNFSINVNGEIVSYKNIYNYSGLVYFNSNSDYVIPYNTSWVNKEYMTIDFGNTPQEVFVVFYDWLIANATQQVYSLSGKWDFNDTLTQTGWASGDTSKYQLINFDLINGDNILNRNVFEYGVRDMYGCVYFSMHFNGATSGHLYSQYHWSSKNYGGCSTTTQSGWHSYWSDFIVDFGNEPQTVSQEFYEWFISNTSPYVDENAIIPLGGTYYRGANIYNGLDTIKNTATTVYNTGEAFPVPQYGDAYVYGDYIYAYQQRGRDGIDWDSSFNDDGWGVATINKNQTTYGQILSYINDKPVLYLDCLFYGNNTIINSPEIPETVISLSCTFYNSSITNAPLIPKSVTSLWRTFVNCDNLANLPEGFTIHDTVIEMYGAFIGCTLLEGNIVINSNPDNIMSIFELVDFNQQNITLSGSSSMLDAIGNTGSNYCSECNGTCLGICIEGNLAPGLYQTGTNTMIYSWQYLLDHEYVFVENGILTTPWDEADGENGSEYVLDGDLVIPNNGSVTELGEYAFRMCYNLTGITIPNTVTEIGAMAFEGISADSITIPSSVKDLGFAVFAYSNFKEIVLEEGIKTIGCGTFMDMWSLETLTLPSTITTIGDHAFARNKFTTLYLPNSIRTIDYNAFLDCNNLTTIYYNDYVMNMLYYVDFADDWNANMPEVNIVCLDRTTTSNSMFAYGHIAGFHEFDPDMTWEEWINSDYNDGQYIIYNNEIYTYDYRYKLVDSSSGTTVKKSDKIKSMRRYTVIDMNPGAGHSAGGGN